MKRAILLLFILASFGPASAQIPSYVPTNGLVGWWPFNGNANDESGNGNNGTVNGATLTPDRFGNSNSAFEFNGLSNYISTAYSGILGNFDRSVSFWAKHNESFDTNQCASCSRRPAIAYGSNITGPSQIGQGFYCEFNIGLTGISFDGNETTAAYQTNSPVNDGSWHHYVYVLSGVSTVTSVLVYQDGSILNTPSYTYLSNFILNTSLGISLEFGRRTYDQFAPTYYKGSLDEIGFWNRALTQQEIDSLYSGASLQPPSPCVSLPINLQNGLVGWWPFCGNANDESGNGNNGINNNASLTADRFNNFNSAIDIDVYASNIQVPISSTSFSSDYTISIWAKVDTLPSLYPSLMEGENSFIVFQFNQTNPQQTQLVFYNEVAATPSAEVSSPVNFTNDWNNYLVRNAGGLNELYINGQLVSVSSTTVNLSQLDSGSYINFGSSQQLPQCLFNGKIDDIGIWNRALTPDEISQLNCGILPIVNPPIAITSTGSNAVLTASASVGNVSYQWQTNPANTGWVNVTDNSIYSGSSTSQLSVSNVQLSNHLQPFRVIASDTNCIDTSNVGVIFISDSCLVTVYDTVTVNDTLFVNVYDTTFVTVYDTLTVTDTLFVTVYDTIYTSVTDTLIITVTGLSSPGGNLDVLVYPNPASGSVQINFGSGYAAMANYNLRIYNAVGANVFGPVSGISQQLYTVPISGWAPGIYFLELVDTGSGNTIVRKILIQ